MQVRIDEARQNHVILPVDDLRGGTAVSLHLFPDRVDLAVQHDDVRRNMAPLSRGILSDKTERKQQ